MRKTLLVLSLLALFGSQALGQVTRGSASRIRFGTALPATCNPDTGTVFFLITPGSPVGMYQCLTTDTFTEIAAGGGGGTVTGTGADNQIAVWTGASDIDGSSSLTFDGTSFAISAVGPHAISGAVSGAIQLIISDTFTSDGSSILAAGLFHTPTIVGAAGDTTSLSGVTFTGAITTQAAVESIANIAQLIIDEPFITDNLTGSITNAQTVLITGAPTEGVTNHALRIQSGSSFLGGKVQIAVSDSEAFFIQKAGGGGPGQDIFIVDSSAAGFPPGNLVRVVGASFLQETASGRNTFGTSTAFDYVFLRIGPTQVISGGASDQAHLFFIDGNIQGFSGDTARINGATFTGSVTTQNIAEAVANVSQVEINEPAITLQGSSTVTDAQSLLITGAPTEGVNNFAFRVAAGATSLGGELAVGSDGSNGQALNVKQVDTTVATAAGSSVTAAGLIPAGSFVIGITTRVTTLVTGPAGYDVGDGNDVDRWGNSIAVALDTTSDLTDATNSALEIFPAANDVVITSDGVDFTGGVIRVVVEYIDLTAPTS